MHDHDRAAACAPMNAAQTLSRAASRGRLVDLEKGSPGLTPALLTRISSWPIPRPASVTSAVLPSRPKIRSAADFADKRFQ